LQSFVIKFNNRIYYGWVIAVSGLIINAALLGLRLTFGVFFKSLESEFELTRLVTSIIASLLLVFIAILAVISGWAADKYGPRRIVFFMGIFTGLSLLLTSQATALWQLFVVYSLLLAAGTRGSIPVIMSLVSRWFDRKRGLALGIAASGGALGTIIIAPFATYLISNLDWRSAYMIIGLITGTIVIVLSLLIRNDPIEIGALPDGANRESSTPEEIKREQGSKQTGLSLKQAFRTRSFWALSFSWLMFAICLQLIMTHLVPHAIDVGLSSMEAAVILSLAGGFSVVFRMLSGMISDYTGRKIPAIGSAVYMAVSLLGLVWSQDTWMFYIFAVVFGFSWGGFGVLCIALAVDSFGIVSIGAIMGVLEMCFAIGAAIGPIIGGYVFDSSNSYVSAFMIGAVAMLITAFLIMFIRNEIDID
jgi:MFS family permease